MARPIYEIAADVYQHWPNVNYAAKPYLEAMRAIYHIHDEYGADSASSVVAYFLANANSWRGEDARRVKKELKEMLAQWALENP